MLPKLVFASVIFSPLNVKITIRGRNIAANGWLLDLKDMKRIEKFVAAIYEKHAEGISKVADPQRFGTEQSIARALFEAADSILDDDDPFEIYAVEIEKFGIHGQYDCRYCPFDLLADSLIKVAFENGFAGDPGETGERIGEAFGAHFGEGLRIGVKKAFDQLIEEMKSKAAKKTAQGTDDFNPEFELEQIKKESIGFCNIDPRDEMSSKEYQEMVRQESTGTFQSQKSPAFDYDEARKFAFDRDHQDHLLRLNAEDSVHWIDRDQKTGKVSILVYFVRSDEGYIVDEFTPENDADRRDMPEYVAEYLKNRIAAGKVAQNQIWLNPMENHQIGQALQKRGISVHLVAKMDNPIAIKIQECLKHIFGKQDAAAAPREVDRSLAPQINNARPGDCCDFCFYPLNEKPPVRFGDYYFNSEKCRIYFKVKNEIPLTDDEQIQFLEYENERNEFDSTPQTPDAMHTTARIIDPQGKATIKRVPMFSNIALANSQFGNVAKHLLSTITVEEKQSDLHFIAPQIDKTARFIQSFAFKSDVAAIIRNEFNAANLDDQLSGLQLLNDATKPEPLHRGSSDHYDLPDDFLNWLRSNNKKILAVFDPNNFGFTDYDHNFDYFGQMNFDSLSMNPAFNPPEGITNFQVTGGDQTQPFFADYSLAENKTAVDEETRRAIDQIPALEKRIEETCSLPRCFICGVFVDDGALLTDKGFLCQDHAQNFDFGQLNREGVAREDQTVASVGAPDPLFAGDVQEFISEETERLQTADLPNVENSTMEENAIIEKSAMVETEPASKDDFGELVAVNDEVIFNAIIDGAICPACGAFKGAKCVSSDEKTLYLISVHKNRIAACDRSNLETFKKNHPLMPNPGDIDAIADFSTMEKTPPPDELIPIASMNGIISGASCPVCNVAKGILCQENNYSVVAMVHAGRIIAACNDQSNLEPIKNVPVILGDNLLKPAAIVENSTMEKAAKLSTMQNQSKELTQKVINSVYCTTCKSAHGELCQDINGKTYDDHVHPARMKLYDEVSIKPELISVIPAPDPNYLYNCENCGVMLQSCPHYRLESTNIDHHLINDNLREANAFLRELLFNEFGISQFERNSTEVAANLLKAYKEKFGLIVIGDLYSPQTPKEFFDIINAVPCPFCKMIEGVNCESFEPKQIFSPMAATVHRDREKAFHDFLSSAPSLPAQFAPIKILEDSTIEMICEKVSCPVPFCDAASGDRIDSIAGKMPTGATPGHRCIYSRDQRPEGNVSINNGVHEARFQNYKDL
jgi:hypothetical protein